eukprot:6175334-Pleurochrysis_carterae.AAC.1
MPLMPCSIHASEILAAGPLHYPSNATVSAGASVDPVAWAEHWQRRRVSVLSQLQAEDADRGGRVALRGHSLLQQPDGLLLRLRAQEGRARGSLQRRLCLHGANCDAARRVGRTHSLHCVGGAACADLLHSVNELSMLLWSNLASFL